MKQEEVKKEFNKQKLIVIGLLFVVPFVLNSNCSTNTDTKLEEGPVPIEILREIISASQDVISCKFNYENIDDSDYTGNKRLSRLELVIDSQAKFNTYIYCDDTVIVNFEEEFVLAGMTTSQPTLISIEEQSMELLNDSLYYRVGIQIGDATQPSAAQYIVKISSKKYLEYPLVFDVFDIYEEIK